MRNILSLDLPINIHIAIENNQVSVTATMKEYSSKTFSAPIKNIHEAENIIEEFDLEHDARRSLEEELMRKLGF